MRLQWRIEPGDAERVRRLVLDQRNAPIVRARRERNVAAEPPPGDRTVIWRAIVGGLLTSRRRSDPAHPVSRFLRHRPFALDYERCASHPDPFSLLQATLHDCGGLGGARGLADQLADNLDWLEDGGWDLLESQLDLLRPRRGGDRERRVADWLDDSLYGFGPRESRRLLLMLGLTRYELPIDARVSQWLNRLPATPRISARAFSDRAYYQLTLDGIQQLSDAADTLPCILDASILAACGLPEDDATCW
jgi:hypothetical protein